MYEKQHGCRMSNRIKEQNAAREKTNEKTRRCSSNWFDEKNPSLPLRLKSPAFPHCIPSSAMGLEQLLHLECVANNLRQFRYLEHSNGWPGPCILPASTSSSPQTFQLARFYLPSRVLGCMSHWLLVQSGELLQSSWIDSCVYMYEYLLKRMYTCASIFPSHGRMSRTCMCE